MTTSESLPTDLAAAHAMILAERIPRHQAEAVVASAKAEAATPSQPRHSFGQHQPLNRQSEHYAREGIDLSLSTLADQVGACAAALQSSIG